MYWIWGRVWYRSDALQCSPQNVQLCFQAALFIYLLIFVLNLFLPPSSFLLLLWSLLIHTPSLTWWKVPITALLQGHRTLCSQSLMGTSWVHQQAQKRVRDWLLSQKSSVIDQFLSILVRNNPLSRKFLLELVVVVQHQGVTNSEVVRAIRWTLRLSPLFLSRVDKASE